MYYGEGGKIVDKEFIQYIKETNISYPGILTRYEIDKIKNTLHYQKWQLEKAWEDFVGVMMETKLGKVIIRIVEFLDRCFNKIF